MSCIKHIEALVVLTCCLVLTASAQVEKSTTWLQSLSDLQNISAADVSSKRADVARIRSEVENWLKQHPSSSITLQVAPPTPWSAEQTKVQIVELRKAVEGILREDPNHPFHLGVTEINVADSVSPLSTLSDSLSQTEMNNRDAINVAKAIDYLPGVDIQHGVAARNEMRYWIRGFSSSGQAPLYLDGIPISVAYDGNIDLARFLTSDIAEVQVSRGISSPLMGPNALGGAINLVTKQPSKRLEGDALMGTGSGNGLLSSLRLGTRARRYFAQGTLDWAQADYIPLSGNFRYPAGGYAALTPGNSLNTVGNVPYALNDEMNNSYFRDEKWGGRIGWTPRGQDEYVFSYVNQKGQKSAPLYMGAYPNATINRFWKWPYWNKDSYYFLSNTGLGERSAIKFRVFYDQFRNSIDMYDNDTYSIMSTSSSEHSKYDEHSDGATSEFTTRLIPRNVISGSVFFKDDTHREQGIYPFTGSKTMTTVVQPWLVDRAQQASIGLQDVITISSRLHATVGFSADHLDGLQAQAYSTSTSPGTALQPVTCISALKNTSYSGCTAHVWTYNPQASLTYAITPSDSVFVTFSDRSRFPLLKDSYSYKMNSALPNPDLKPEHSRNLNIGYSRVFKNNTFAQVQLFRSDLRDAIESYYYPDPTYNATTGAATCPGNDPKTKAPWPAPGQTGSTAYQGYCSQSINIGREVHQGVEAEVRSTLFTRLTLDANYSYLNRSYEYRYSDFPSVPVMTAANWQIWVNQARTGLPKNKAVGSATLRLPRQVLGTVTARYEGGNDIQDTNMPNASGVVLGNKAPFYKAAMATLDLATVVPVGPRFTAQAGIKNLLDRNYFYTAGYPEEGRNWFLNLRYQF